MLRAAERIRPSYVRFLSAYMAVIDEGKAPTHTALGKAPGVAKQTAGGSWRGTPT